MVPTSASGRLTCSLLLQLEAVAECASRLKLLSEALDVSDRRLERSLASQEQELLRLQVAGLGFEVKESLLEAHGLVLLANNQVDTEKSGELSQTQMWFFWTNL